MGPHAKGAEGVGAQGLTLSGGGAEGAVGLSQSGGGSSPRQPMERRLCRVQEVTVSRDLSEYVGMCSCID